MAFRDVTKDPIKEVWLELRLRVTTFCFLLNRWKQRGDAITQVCPLSWYLPGITGARLGCNRVFTGDSVWEKIGSGGSRHRPGAHRPV